MGEKKQKEGLTRIYEVYDGVARPSNLYIDPETKLVVVKDETEERKDPKCPTCGETTHLDVYSAPSCSEGPVKLHCCQCGTKFDAETGEIEEGN